MRLSIFALSALWISVLPLGQSLYISSSAGFTKKLHSVSSVSLCKQCIPESVPQYSSTFVYNCVGPVTEAEISNDNLIRIVNLETSDAQCNELCWKCLGYIRSGATEEYSNENVFPKWREKYPTPPDLIGTTRNYDSAVDKEVRNANMNLMRSIPRDYKGGVRALESVGFKGFKLKELTPNKTRRAQVYSYYIAVQSMNKYLSHITCRL